MLKEAKKLHSMGLAVHWLHPRSKAPIGKNWASGPRKEWSELKRTYREGNNLGVRLGTPSKLEDGYYLAVIDCDVKSTDTRHLREMSAKLKELFDHDAPQVHSGRGNGSAHIYVRTKTPIAPYRFGQSPDMVRVKMPSVKPSKRDRAKITQEDLEAGWRIRPAWEISVMGEGQQVVLPPSVHPDSGREYEWGSPLDDAGDIPSLSVESKARHEKLAKSKVNFEPEEFDLALSDLDAEWIAKIMSGDGVEDRSAACYGAAIAMIRAGFTDNQILNVLTDRENALGEVAFEHAQTESQTRAAAWIYNYTLAKAHREISADNDFDDLATVVEKKLSPEEAAKQKAELLAADWRNQLDRNQQDGRPRNTFANLKKILVETMREQIGEDPFIARNSFRHEDVWQVDTPWGSRQGAVIQDIDLINIKEWCARKYRMEPPVDRVDEVLLHISAEHSFHPVRDYLDELEWDGTERISTWLVDYMGAVGPKDYLKAVGEKLLVAMVARIYVPGIKYDQVVIFEGEQGLGKSTAASILAAPWFSDAHLNIGDKDSVMNMQGVWVHELGELSAMSRAEVNSVKEFITRRVDRMRPPYGRKVIEYPRQSVFIGTTNNEEYLKDRTGNRRFWPVKVTKFRRAELERDRDQLLAEAVTAYNLGESLWIDDKAVEATAAEEQAKRMEHDELEDQLLEYLENVDPKKFDRKCFRVIDLLFSDCRAVAGMKNDKVTQMRLSSALKRIGYERDTFRYRNGANAKWWFPKGRNPKNTKA